MQVERQKSDAVVQCQRTAAERDEAIQSNRFLQSKLKDAENALKELGQNVKVISQMFFSHDMMCVHACQMRWDILFEAVSVVISITSYRCSYLSKFSVLKVPL